MKIKKNGIFRNISERQFPEYKAKGYVPVVDKEKEPAKPGKKDVGTKAGG